MGMQFCLWKDTLEDFFLCDGLCGARVLLSESSLYIKLKVQSNFEKF